MFVLKWERLAISDYVQRSIDAGFPLSREEAHEFRNEYMWEWQRVMNDLKIRNAKKITLTIIAIDQIIKHNGAENYACKPGLN